MEQLSAPLLFNPAQPSFILLCRADPGWRAAQRHAVENHQESQVGGREEATEPIRGRQPGPKVTLSDCCSSDIRKHPSPSRRNYRHSGDAVALRGVSAGARINIPHPVLIPKIPSLCSIDRHNNVILTSQPSEVNPSMVAVTRGHLWKSGSSSINCKCVYWFSHAKNSNQQQRPLRIILLIREVNCFLPDGF